MPDNMGGPHWLEADHFYEFGSVKAWNIGRLRRRKDTYLFRCLVATERGTAVILIHMSETILLDTAVDVGGVICSLARNEADHLPDPISTV